MYYLNRRKFILSTAGSLFAATRISAQEGFQSDDTIRQILIRRIDKEKRSVGMAVGTLNRGERRIVVHGQTDTNSHPITQDTIFEVGSITKVFTALLLTEMVIHDELSFDDTLARYLPRGFRVPEMDGRLITLADLATHTSGLPLFPPIPGNPLESIGGYQIEDLQSWMADFTLKRPPGNQWEYSNVGYALLGQALANRAGKTYASLLQERILSPLRLQNTSLNVPPDTTNLTKGHDLKLNVVPPLEIGIFSPAGALHSTVADLLTFAEGVMPNSGSPVEASAQLLLSIRRPAPAIGGDQALGWEVITDSSDFFLSKDGVTAGQGASVVLDPAAYQAVVVLSNTLPQIRKPPPAGGIGATDLARHLLRPVIPLG